MTDPAAARSRPAQQEKEDEMHEENQARVGPSVPCVATTGSTAEQSPGAVTAAERLTTLPLGIIRMRRKSDGKIMLAIFDPYVLVQAEDDPHDWCLAAANRLDQEYEAADPGPQLDEM
jgi:hypothetical protein